MKINMNRLLIAFLLSVSLFRSYAQDVKLKAIPYVMYFENVPLDYKIKGDNQIWFSAPPNTDLFIAPDGGFEINKSPRLIFKPDSDFIFTAKIQPDFKSKWDAGALLIYNDGKHFAKFCFEKDYKQVSRVVSVVCNEVADDCNSMAVTTKEVYYRITGSVKGNTFTFYYSENGKSWFLVRTFRLDKADNIRIGFTVQSASGKPCSADFSDIDFQPRKPVDWWNGN